MMTMMMVTMIRMRIFPILREGDGRASADEIERVEARKRFEIGAQSNTPTMSHPESPPHA